MTSFNPDEAAAALKNAVAAGNLDAARKIADALDAYAKHQQASMPAPREEVGHAGGMAAHATQGALWGAGDEYLAGLSAVLGVQPDGNGGAKWFDYSKPMNERYGTALEAIRSEMGEYREDHPVLATGSQIAGGVTTAVAAGSAAPVKAAATTTGRVAQVAGGGAVAGGIEGFNSGEGGLTNRAITGGIGTVAGAVFAPIVGAGMSQIVKVAENIGGKALAAVFRNRRLYDRETGDLTEAGRKRLAALGFDANELSKEMQRSFGRAAELVQKTDDLANDALAVERIAQSDRFNVPLTRGQATGEVTQSAAEESMRAGVRGKPASDVMATFDTVQGKAVEDARENISTNLGGNAGDTIDAAGAVIDGVRREASRAQQAGSAAYDALEESGAAIKGGSLDSVVRQISNGVRSEGVSIDAGTPNANSMLNVIKSAFEESKGGAVPFMAIERARQRMLTFKSAAFSGSNGADQIASKKIVEQFDEWFDDTISTALISGRDAIVGEAKNARALWAQYKRTFLGKEGADKFIRKIVQDELSPDQVANWIYGASRKIGGGQTSLLAKRLKDILGADSAEFQAVKRAAWDKITTNNGERLGPQAVASNIEELLTGKGKTLARQLFTADEMRTIGEFSRMLKTLVPPRKATNHSGSGYQVERGMQTLLQGFAGLLGNATGGPVAGAASAGAVRSGTSFQGTLAAKAAASGVVPKKASIPVAIGSGVASGAAAQDQFLR